MKILKKRIVGVCGVACNQEGKYLITLRNDPRHPSMHRKWHLPGGGMEFGESPEETLIRELKEEIGVSARIISPYPIIRSLVRYKVVHFILIYYLVSLDNQKIILDQRENIEYRFVTLNELNQYDCIHPTPEIIRKMHDLRIENGWGAR